MPAPSPSWLRLFGGARRGNTGGATGSSSSCGPSEVLGPAPDDWSPGAVVAPRFPAPVQELAPAPVGVSAGLRAPGEERFGRHDGVVTAFTRGRVGVAPAHVEDFPRGIGVWLAARTVRAGDDCGVREKLRHRTVARMCFAIKIHASTGGSRQRNSTAIVGRGPAGSGSASRAGASGEASLRTGGRDAIQHAA